MAWKRILIVGLVVLLSGGLALSGNAAQKDADFASIGQRVQELYKAKKYEEMLPVLDEYRKAVKARFGDKSKEYLTAISFKATILNYLNRQAEAEPFYRQGLALSEELYGASDKRVLEAIDSLALMLEAKLAKYDEAEALMRRSLAIRKTTFGEESLEVAENLERLGVLLTNTNRRAEAEPLLRQALAIREKAGSPEAASSMGTLANLLSQTGRRKEAEVLFRRSLKMLEKAHGPNSTELTTVLNGLANCLSDERKFAEAEVLYRRAITIADTAPSPNHALGMKVRHNLAGLFLRANRLSEAEELYKSVAAFKEKTYGPDYPDLATTLSDLGVLAHIQGRFTEAEQYMQRAMAILDKKGPGREQFYVVTLSSLGKLLADTGKFEKAEPILRRAAKLAEELHGPEQKETADALNALAMLLTYTYRLSDAETLQRRTLAIDEKIHGPKSIDVAETLFNLSITLRETDKADEAEKLGRRALAIYERSLPPDHPSVAQGLSGLSLTLEHLKQFTEAEKLQRRALSIAEASLESQHPQVAVHLNNLAMILSDTGRYKEAEPMMRRVITIWEAAYGKDSPDVAGARGNLAILRAKQNDWQEALQEIRRTSAYTINSVRRAARTSKRAARHAFNIRRGNYLTHAQMAYHANHNDPQLREEAFGVAQRATTSQAAAALAWSARRFGLRKDRLGALIREQHELVTRLESVRRWLVEAWSAGKKGASEIAQNELARIEPRLKEIEAQLAREFPDYVAFANPEPLSIERVQALLHPNEALVQFLTISRGALGDAVYAWAITREQVKWVELPISYQKLRDHVTALRCGLDQSGWIDPSSWPEQTEAERKRKRTQAKKRKLCLELTDEAPSLTRMPRFDLVRAHELYQALFGSIKELTGGKELLIVPSGALTQLPFEVMVTKAPEEAASRTNAYRAASWLGVQQAITILPSVSSLEVLRKRGGKSKAARPFAGFGNPLLDGNGEGDPRAKAARERQQCRPPSKEHGDIRSVAPASLEVPTEALFIGSVADTGALRRQTPLPETADELCTVARDLGAESDLWLGSRMTERAIKALSASQKLKDYRILHFATHGLVAGDLNGAEPSLMFTPPKSPTEEDDGLLTASEAAQLELDADWVVMSACNTAAGDAEDAEALAGLTRAFFYAGARSLLVSHWAVNSDAAVEITTGAFTAMTADPKIGRAEALRRSLKSLIAKGGVAAHPAIWAPFVLVGEGGR